MRTVALVSGGKDSCYNMMQCVAAGHTIVALANLQPQHKDELDSYMYQTVGHQGIELYAEAMGLPLYREVITGVAVDQSRNYKPTENDEVEDLYRLLSRVKDELSIEAVSVGAILSDYQRIRVENVCRRLGLVSLAYLWRRNQKELLQEMIDSKVEAIIIKVAALGLTPAEHLGRTLSSMQAPLRALRTKYGLNVCGEGGEYETFTLDCPLFRKRLVVDEKEVVIHSNDPVAPVGYLNLKLHLEPKDESELQMPPSVRSPLDFVNELSDSAFSDVSDKELSETEMESIEKLEKAEKMKGEGVKSLSYTELNDEKSDGEENESLESIEDGYAERDYELPPVVDHRSIYGNDHGWYFIGGIVGEGTDTAEATEVALQKLISLLSTEELSLPDVCSVNIYMRDMEDYSALNEAYASHFCFENPPTRVCVQCPLPDDVGLIMDAVAFRPVASNQDSDGAPKTRRTMHVQGISHWAPANIGPYSQAFKIGEAISTCGVIALVAGSLALCHGGPRAQCGLALTHLARLIRAIAPRATIRSVVQSVCYTVCVGAVAGSRRAFERRTAGSLAQFAVVGALPRKAGVEWHAWAHTGNYRFEYEETGCDIGDYKVAITRRWNYDNTVSAFVCYVATGSSPSSHQVSLPAGPERAAHRQRAASVSAAQLRRAMDYALGKLLADRKPGRTAVTVRVFYQASSAPSPSALSALLSAAAAARAAATAVPVLALHNGLTFLSIAGLRVDE